MIASCFATVLIALAPVADARVWTADADLAALLDGLPPELVVDIRVVANKKGGLVVHEVRGTLRGVPLARPVARILADADGRVLLLHRFGGVPPAARASGPEITADEALARVRALRVPGSQGPAQAQLVFVPETHRSRLVWRVDPPLDRANLADPVFEVDAHTRDVRVAYDRVRSASVRAFSPNPVVAPRAAEFELDEIDPGATNLIGPSWRALNCVDPAGDGVCTPQAVATADLQGNFLFPAPDISDPVQATALGDAFAEATAYYHADRFHTHLQGLGLPGIPCQVDGQVPTIVTNYGSYSGGEFEPFEDAVYAGECDFTIAVGQGPTLDLALEGDILYHEIGHGVIQQAIGPSGFLGVPRFLPEAVANDAGAIGEAVADFLSSSFTGTPYMGEYLRDYGVLVAGRDNANTFTCPGGLMGKVHQDGEPFAAALWESFQILGSDFIPVVVDAVGMFSDDVSFEDAAEIVAVVAGAELGAEAETTVREAFTVRGLTDCQRIVPWAEVERGMWLFPPGLVGAYDPILPPPYQVELDVPAGVETVTVQFELEDFLFQPREPDSNVGLLQKAGSPITFAYESGPSAVTVTHDADAEVGDGNAGSVELSVAEGKVFLAFVNIGSTPTILTGLQVTFAPTPGGSSGGGDGGVDATGGSSSGDSVGTGTTGATTTGDTAGEAAGDGGGCGCRASGGGRLPTGVVWLVLLVARRRRG